MPLQSKLSSHLSFTWASERNQHTFANLPEVNDAGMPIPILANQPHGMLQSFCSVRTREQPYPKLPSERSKHKIQQHVLHRSSCAKRVGEATSIYCATPMYLPPYTCTFGVRFVQRMVPVKKPNPLRHQSQMVCQLKQRSSLQICHEKAVNALLEEPVLMNKIQFWICRAISCLVDDHFVVITTL